MRTLPGSRLLPITSAVVSIVLTVKLLMLGCAVLFGLSVSSLRIFGSAEAGVLPSKDGVEPAITIPTPPATLTATRSKEPLLDAPTAPPLPVSEAERQLLSDLRSRRQQLDAREHELADRSALLSAAEQRIVERINQLSALRSQLDTMDAARREHEEANWSGIVKVYEVMKPNEAASIFNELDMGVLIEVADRMKETKLALILAAMQPERARFLTIQLAGRRTRAGAPAVPQANEG